MSRRRLQNLPPLARPLPHKSPVDSSGYGQTQESYDIVVCGAGPAGLLLSLELARYGVSDDRLLCIDAGPAVKAGHADGLHPRALEILGSLGLTDPILREGAKVCEVTEWASSPEDGKLKRVASHRPGMQKMPRYPDTFNLAQGRLERILADDLINYSERGVLHLQKLVGLIIDETGSLEYPVKVEIQSEGGLRTVRAQFVVGADGSHSSVRQLGGLKMEGDSSDHLWGVVDAVLETDFPDIRKLATIKSDKGTMITVPRERLENDQYLTRIYVFMRGDKDPQKDKTFEEIRGEEGRGSKTDDPPITLDDILTKMITILGPYTLRIKGGTEVEWWSCYQIGQRLASQFVIKDSKLMPRVFLIGDAAHTHSPKVAQGVNVALADAHDLAWKIAHTVQGLTCSPSELLSTYELDRQDNARNLIDFDKRFYGAKFKKALERTQDETVARNVMLREAGTFIAGINVEYAPGHLVDDNPSNLIKGDVLGGALHTGRVLQNVRVTRFADGRRDYNLCEDFPADGRVRILVLSSQDILDSKGKSATALQTITNKTMPKYTAGVLKIVIVCPLDDAKFGFVDLGQHVKQQAEFHLHCDVGADAYAVYGVDPKVGAMAVVRPDGFIGTVAGLDDQGIERIEQYLRRFLKAC